MIAACASTAAKINAVYKSARVADNKRLNKTEPHIKQRQCCTILFIVLLRVIFCTSLNVPVWLVSSQPSAYLEVQRGL